MLSNHPFTRRSLSILIGALFLLVIIPGAYFYWQYQTTQKMLKTPAELAKEQQQQMLSRVNMLMELPKGEDPSIEILGDLNIDKAKLYFTNAKNSDVLISFESAKKVILYRPSQNKIIDVTFMDRAITPTAPDKKAQPTPTKTAKSTPTPTLTPEPTAKPAKITVALYNGTKTSGLAARIERQIQPKAPEISVVVKANAVNDYTEIRDRYFRQK